MIAPHYQDDTLTIFHGDCRDVLPMLPPESVQMIVTSPPYFHARDYGEARQIGLEPTPAGYVGAICDAARGMRHVLKPDGVLWLNLGDCYAQDSKWGGKSGDLDKRHNAKWRMETGLPDKNLIGIPWRVAFALQDDGWILRNEIIWEKINGKPESVRDRLTVTHETIFLFAKSADYYFDVEAIREPATSSDRRPVAGSKGGRSAYPEARARKSDQLTDAGHHTYANLGTWEPTPLRRARTIWRIPTANNRDAHYAVFPEALVERCLLAGSRVGDVVCDPFGGSGTTARVAERLGRRSILIDLKGEYLEIQQQRTATVQRSIEAYL